MNRCSSLALIALGGLAPSAVLAQSAGSMPPASPAPKLSGMPTAAEQPFIDAIAQQIPKLYPTTAAAAKAGYFQYTKEDNTGAISWVNLALYDSLAIDKPNQLWYDVNGKILGVDYTVLTKHSAQPPETLFGSRIEPGRWHKRGAHIHYAFTGGDGKPVFGEMSVARLVAAGANPSETDPAVPANKDALVKANVVGLTSAQQVLFVFLHSEMWDTYPWVIPNPDGAWAEYNPTVKPAPPKPAPM